MSLRHNIISAINFYWQAKTLNNIQSPFLFEILNHLQSEKKEHQSVSEIVALIAQLNQSKRLIQLTDYGQGSKKHNKSIRSVAEVSKISSSSYEKAMTWACIVDYIKPKELLELGTNLGLSSICIKDQNPDTSITTIEGDPALFTLSQNHFESLKLNIKGINAQFDPYLRNLDKKYDMIILDGNHSYDATLRYFNRLYHDNLKAVIVDDIYWSPGMTKAWQELCQEFESIYHIDFYQFGLIVFDPSLDNRLGLKFIDRKYKPLSFGFFAESERG